ncbi:hemolysin III family protein [Aquabacterium soli]|uniref:Hemolysin III family protein n=1 Tax=Aquabacterium soli TaxID=2493092 RepID=A0A426VD44_9BURK|nr:hemolysin III family protein [Aquabacterium soli]RRS04795.1 hemolysin III family protein [Aquabacterium soli]
MYPGERFNSFTHLAGALLAVAGSAALVAQAIPTGDTWKILGVSVFGLTMVLLYAASTLYHSLRGPAKQFWAKMDHCAIYLLIAGTYTPFALIGLQGVWRWALLSAIWALAVIGIAKELWLGREKVPSVPLYLLMGWLGITAVVPLAHSLSAEGLMWLLAGGLFYTVGVIFYAMDGRWRHSHGVWHLFVLGGTASHYVTVMRFLV